MVAAVPGFGFGDLYVLGLAFLGIAVVVAIVALSHEHERAFSASLIYLALGLAAAAAVEVLGIHWLDPVDDAKVVERLAEFCVIVALFSTGLKLDRELSWTAWGSVVRLLAVVMPMTIIAVAAFGAQVMGLSFAAAVVLGGALAPTDPVLAGDIGVGPPGEEDETEPNFSVTGEAGLNDGLAFPFVLFGLFAAAHDDWNWVGEWLAADVVYAVVVGVAIGAVAGYGFAAVFLPLRDRKLLSPDLDGWMAIGAVLLIYGLTEFVGGYGFLAAFAGGLAFRRYERRPRVPPQSSRRRRERREALGASDHPAARQHRDARGTVRTRLGRLAACTGLADRDPAARRSHRLRWFRHLNPRAPFSRLVWRTRRRLPLLRVGRSGRRHPRRRQRDRPLLDGRRLLDRLDHRARRKRLTAGTPPPALTRLPASVLAATSATSGIKPSCHRRTS